MTGCATIRRHPDLTLAGATILLRLSLLAGLFFARGETWGHLLSVSDGGGYLAVAKAIFGVEPASAVTVYDSRLFPGWPAFFGGWLWAGLPDGSMLAVSLGTVAIVPVLFRRLTDDVSLAWHLVYLTPAWLLATTHPMSEAFYLATVLAALLALKHRHGAISGMLGGALLTIRPFGVAWCTALFAAQASSAENRLPRLARFAGMAALPVLAMLALNHRLYGDALRQFHVYELPLSQLNLTPAAAEQLGAPASHRGLPFAHVLLTPWRTTVPTWKTIYIYGHVALLLVLARRAFVEIRAPAPDWQQALAIGFLGNGLLIVCGGPYWGFHSFDRYFVWGLPGALWLARDWLRVRPWVHFVFAPASIAMAGYGLWRHA